MTEYKGKQLELTITKIEETIESYSRLIKNAKCLAAMHDENGKRESAKFNRGQEAALAYAIKDLEFILQSLKAIK